MALVFLFLILLIKAFLVRAMCAKLPPDLTASQETVARLLALVTCFLPVIGTACIVVFMFPFALAMGNAPLRGGDLGEEFQLMLLSVPLYFDWILNFFITLVCWVTYSCMGINQPLKSACLAYFVIVIFEYVFSFSAWNLLKPH